ncbi:PQQ-dependent sugar dehydrogenase [Shewanella schlegeliana]|uniref:PQQ-dependent sugar dehydrogenase n=1 Tax=Shewanella schlegeliana TaxID=190308 RepID=A0ABS1SW75_9GAMM|nr:PQQ-dependent sugar dehydrogenase [Shewanella schlegeliana]MBL4912795.1 PQQ-dependent sugar dehydrogenase [Shewanella schlegeliana]MCL1109107.1 PQQ-dependent sugar dehydrogenase [Shewanella schlegeliana]GIU37999.1 L-sorbosone dehydrogenase [Shewanella schlegeliana]
MTFENYRNQLAVGISLLCAHFIFSCSALAAEPVMITVSKGFGLTLYASDLGDAKQLAVGDKGTLFVGSYRDGTITALVDADNDGRVDKRYVIAKGLDYPEAIAFHNGDLYVAEEERILRFNQIESRLRRPGRPKEVYERLPGNSKKSRRAMQFGPDGLLYIAIGAPCNVCETEAPYSSIIAIDVETGDSEQIVSGVRKVLAFDWAVEDNQLWFADLGRDWMGDNLPPDEINKVERKGSHFGFPYIHATDIIEPAYDKPKNLKVVSPTYELPAHVGAKGLHFYRGTQFPERFHNQMFVAENGSWNRSSKVGYQVVMLEIKDGQVAKRSTVVSFLDGEFPVARPYALVTAPDGAMYISDDLKGNVYRLFYKESAKNQSQDND